MVTPLAEYYQATSPVHIPEDLTLVPASLAPLLFHLSHDLALLCHVKADIVLLASSCLLFPCGPVALAGVAPELRTGGYFL